MSVDLSVDLGRGLIAANPVGLASGTAGFGLELAELIDLDEIGVLFTKGTTREAREGNAPPRVAETEGGMLNSIGLQNPGVEHVAREYAPRFAEWRCRVVVNVAGASTDEYVACVRILDEVAGVDGYELNISCPNIAHGMDLGRDPRAAAAVTAAVRAVTDRCVVVKLSPNVSDIAVIARAVEEAGADAVSAVNTYVGMKMHRHLRRPVLARSGTGGLSGPAIKPLALAAVASLRRAVSIPLIGIGGIVQTGDALDFFVAGADMVQVGTATFANPATGVDIARGIAAFCVEAGVASPTALRWTGPQC
ncbi:MAG: dihydroorotate dehydrogenase [Candidatus Dormibacteria bacterium]